MVRALCNSEVSPDGLQTDRKDMLDDQEWDQNTVLHVIFDQTKNPFTLKETTESLSVDWEETAEVLNQGVVRREFTGGW
jgi:hypothetical protein